MTAISKPSPEPEGSIENLSRAPVEAGLEPVREIRVPQQARSRRTRERTLEAAADCFEERGFDETTTDEIARRAGISVGSVYAYFRDKRAILLELLHRTIAEIAEIVEAGLAPGAWRDDDPRGSVRELVGRIFHARQHRPGTQRILWERFFKDPEFQAVMESFEVRLQGAIVANLERLAEQGKLRISDLATATYLVQLSIEWVSSRLLLSEPAHDVDAIADAASDMVVRFLFRDDA
ncbi:TetR/AcrR family transcriptional regulator [Myxococcota bacterium]|nr:TetR/AcrR family transcriptional regulator [Myxococcota bacterium]